MILKAINFGNGHCKVKFSNTHFHGNVAFSNGAGSIHVKGYAEEWVGMSVDEANAITATRSFSFKEGYKHRETGDIISIELYEETRQSIMAINGVTLNRDEDDDAVYDYPNLDAEFAIRKFLATWKEHYVERTEDVPVELDWRTVALNTGNEYITSEYTLKTNCNFDDCAIYVYDQQKAKRDKYDALCAEYKIGTDPGPSFEFNKVYGQYAFTKQDWSRKVRGTLDDMLKSYQFDMALVEKCFKVAKAKHDRDKGIAPAEATALLEKLDIIKANLQYYVPKAKDYAKKNAVVNAEAAMRTMLESVIMK